MAEKGATDFRQPPVAVRELRRASPENVALAVEEGSGHPQAGLPGAPDTPGIDERVLDLELESRVALLFDHREGAALPESTLELAAHDGRNVNRGLFETALEGGGTQSPVLFPADEVNGRADRHDEPGSVPRGALGRDVHRQIDGAVDG